MGVLSSKTITSSDVMDRKDYILYDRVPMKPLDVALQIGPHGGRHLQRAMQPFTRIIVLVQLCISLNKQFELNCQIQKTVSQIHIKTRGNILVSKSILSFLGFTHEEEEIFKDLIWSYRPLPPCYWDSVSYRPLPPCYWDSVNEVYVNYKPEVSTLKILLSELPLVKKFARLYSELHKSLGRYSSGKNNRRVQKMFNECEEQCSFILSFREKE